MKYKVAQGASFVAGGDVYGPGDTIDASLFSPEALKRAQQPSKQFPKGKLIDPTKADAESKAKDDKTAPKPASENKNHEDAAGSKKV